MYECPVLSGSAAWRSQWPANVSINGEPTIECVASRPSNFIYLLEQRCKHICIFSANANMRARRTYPWHHHCGIGSQTHSHYEICEISSYLTGSLRPIDNDLSGEGRKKDLTLKGNSWSMSQCMAAVHAAHSFVELKMPFNWTPVADRPAGPLPYYNMWSNQHLLSLGIWIRGVSMSSADIYTLRVRQPSTKLHAITSVSSRPTASIPAIKRNFNLWILRFVRFMVVS